MRSSPIWCRSVTASPGKTWCDRSGRAATSRASTKTVEVLTHYPCGAHVTYENGAKVNTSFVSNLDGDIVVDTWPELTAAIAEVEKSHRGNKKRTLVYPRNLASAAKIAPLSRHGVHLRLKHSEVCRVSKVGGVHGIFGGGLLLSDCAASKLDAAFRDAEHAVQTRKDIRLDILQLSDADKEIIAELNANDGTDMVYKHIRE